MAMGQNSVPPVNTPIPTKIGSKMGGAPTPKWDPVGFDPQPHHLERNLLLSLFAVPRPSRRPPFSRKVISGFLLDWDTPFQSTRD